ncbi:hypothetical protein AERO9AM_30601 [Aeromicrobium sp. 9AM]|nr:hypothetical protein AERO9AM_30601 [Aeromicrobium sp. 9AM]
MITPTSPSTASEASHARQYGAIDDIIRAAQLADYIPRRAKARHVEEFGSEFDRHISESAAWIIRCVRVHPNRPVGAHVAWGTAR